MRKNENGPHVKRSGQLLNGNPSGDPSKARRCEAKTRQKTKCLAPAMKNGRCRLHGGKSTEPRTPAGLDKCRRAALKHGDYTAEAKAQRKHIASFFKEAKEFLNEF
jgi:hypothetical protein